MIKILLALLVFCVSVLPRFASAAMIVRTATINIITNTVPEDGVFNYRVAQRGAINGNYVNFDNSTIGGAVTKTLVVDALSGLYYDIFQNIPEGWKIESILCSSDSPSSGYYPFEDGVSLVLAANTTVTCSFNNAKKPAGKTPVLIIPGIAGTKLYSGNDEIWPDLSKMFWDLGDEFLVEKLGLDGNGIPNNLVEAKEVLDKIHIILKSDKNYFNFLIDQLEIDGYEEGQSLFLFPYDWRIDLDKTADALKGKIDQIKQQTGSQKVDIVAHSMGGLLAKTHIQAYGSEEIRKLIFVGTPHLGAPKAYRVLRGGDDFGIPWLRDSAIKQVAQNMPTIYELLPQVEYFDKFQPYLGVLKPGEGFVDLGFQESMQYLKNVGYNANLLEKAGNWADSIKDLSLGGYGDIQAYNISGCKTGTEAKYGVVDENHAIYMTGFTSGDGTVPFESSDALLIPIQNKFYLRKADHAQMPSVAEVRQAISEILRDENVSVSKNFSNSPAFCGLNGKSLSWRSPVEVHIYDNAGNHTGPVEGGTERSIPGVGYEMVDGHKFMFLPTDDSEVYRVEGIGLEQGSFDLVIKDIQQDAVVGAHVFNDVPIVLGSKVESLVFSGSDDSTITFDAIGDGNSQKLSESAYLAGEVAEDIVPPHTRALASADPNKDGWFRQHIEVSLSSTDIGSGILETKYSLNGDAYQPYKQSVTISQEGMTSFKYFSVDKAGNNEETKELVVKIDKTPPEVMVNFDEDEKDIVFTGLDNLTDEQKLEVSDLGEEVSVSDLAGNTTKLLLKEKNRKKSLSAELDKLSYNGVPADIHKNRFNFVWKYSKQGSLQLLFQSIKNNNDFMISSVYNGKNTIQISRIVGEKPLIKKFEGLKIIKIESNKGKLTWE